MLDKRSPLVGISLLLLVTVVTPVSFGDLDAEDVPARGAAEDLAKKTENSVSDLISVPI